jgi:hypothetical protein
MEISVAPEIQNAGVWIPLLAATGVNDGSLVTCTITRFEGALMIIGCAVMLKSPATRASFQFAIV